MFRPQKVRAGGEWMSSQKEKVHRHRFWCVRADVKVDLQAVRAGRGIQGPERRRLIVDLVFDSFLVNIGFGEDEREHENRGEQV